MNNSDFIVFVDESGDHGLESIDPNYPVFVLSFCILRKSDFVDVLTPSLQNFKLKHFGHDQIVLHESDIRRDRAGFAALKNPELKAAFMTELTDIVATIPFTLVASVIDKRNLTKAYLNPGNPYHIALTFGLERVFYFLKSQGAGTEVTHIVVEKRGKKEDDELELEFRRVCDGGNFKREQLPFEIVFADKKANSLGLQLADLTARPIGLHILRPNQANRAYEVVETKFYQSPNGKVRGWGLKCFP